MGLWTVMFGARKLPAEVENGLEKQLNDCIAFGRLKPAQFREFQNILNGIKQAYPPADYNYEVIDKKVKETVDRYGSKSARA